MTALALQIRLTAYDIKPDKRTGNLLWHPEKRLCEAAKTDEVNEGYDDDNAPDYANAAILVAKNAGASDEQIRQANEAVDARLRSNVSSAGAG